MHAPLTLFELALASRRDKFGNDVRADPRSRQTGSPTRALAAEHLSVSTM